MGGVGSACAHTPRKTNQQEPVVVVGNARNVMPSASLCAYSRHVGKMERSAKPKCPCLCLQQRSHARHAGSGNVASQPTTLATAYRRQQLLQVTGKAVVGRGCKIFCCCCEAKTINQLHSKMPTAAQTNLSVCVKITCSSCIVCNVRGCMSAGGNGVAWHMRKEGKAWQGEKSCSELPGGGGTCTGRQAAWLPVLQAANAAVSCCSEPVSCWHG